METRAADSFLRQRVWSGLASLEKRPRPWRAMWVLSRLPPSTRQGPRPPSTSMHAPGPGTPPCRVGRVLSQGLRARARRHVQSPGDSFSHCPALQLHEACDSQAGQSTDGAGAPSAPAGRHLTARMDDAKATKGGPPLRAPIGRVTGTQASTHGWDPQGVGHRTSTSKRPPGSGGGRLNRGLPTKKQLEAKGSRSPRPRPASGLRQEMLCVHPHSPGDPLPCPHCRQ